MGSVIVLAVRPHRERRRHWGRCRLKAELLIGLVKARQAGKHFLRPRKHIAHIMKNRKANAVIKIRHGNVWKTHLQTVEEHSAAADGKPG